MTTVTLAGKMVGEGHPCFVIAEAGLNHNGDVNIALQLVDKAKACGADAVKFQKRTIDRILTRDALNQPYGDSNSYGATYGEHRYALELSKKDWQLIAQRANQKGIIWFASPWDEESADFLESLEMHIYKIASADLTNLPLLRHVASKGKPVIMSTGMSTMQEIDEGVETVLAVNPDLVLLHCVSAYPFEPALANLKMIPVLADRFPNVVIGYSGHEKSGMVVSLGASVLGAHVIERHFTLDRTMKGSDHAASLEAVGMSQLIENIHKLEISMGDGTKRIYQEEVSVRTKLGKSVTAAVRIDAGNVIKEESLVMKSPGDGLSGRFVKDLVGRIAAEDIDTDQQLPIDALEWKIAGDS